MRKYAYILTTAAALALASCSTAEEPDNGDDGIYRELPVEITIASSWDAGDPTRDAPNDNAGTGAGSEFWTDNGYAETEAVDMVRLITFRRLSPEDHPDADPRFRYDAQNDVVVPCAWEASESETDIPPATAHKHKKATATIRKHPGYEYRVVAIAYSSTRALPYATNNDVSTLCGKGLFLAAAGEHNWFTTSGTTMQDYCLNVATQQIYNNSNSWRKYLIGNTVTQQREDQLSKHVMCTPQFFYGVCTGATGNEIIGDDEQIGLKGILYRAVAKVELRFKKMPKYSGTYNYDWVAVMADGVATSANMENYDCFLEPGADAALKGKYTAIGYGKIDNEKLTETCPEDAAYGVITMYLLPCRTRLALRGLNGTISAWIGVVGNYNTYYGISNGQICADDIDSSGEEATGIISPDVADNEFFFRRNHKYILTVDEADKFFWDHNF